MALSPQANKMLKVGDNFNRLTVVNFVRMQGSGHAIYKVHCDCGTEFEVLGSSVKSNNTKSCGCLHRDRVATHGLSQSPTYKSWLAMKSRCLSPNAMEQKYYAGIGLCERWLVFENFLADMGERPPGTSIERRDGTKGYAPDNCYWATPKQQIRNRRNTVRVTLNGVTLPLGEWAEVKGIGYATAWCRLKAGWTVEDALQIPVRPKQPTLRRLANV